MRFAAAVVLILPVLAGCQRIPPKTLAEAAARGTMEEVTAQINLDPSRIDLAGDDGETPLRIAARAGNTDAVRVLVHHGASVDLLDTHGRSALHLAAIAGHSDCIRLLVGAGADWKLEDLDGRTPLLEAVRAKQSDAAATLREVAGSTRPHHGPPTTLFGAAVRRAPTERIFHADSAGRAAASSLEWGDAAHPHAYMLRIDASDAPHPHRERGEVHVFVVDGNVRASASGTNDVDLKPGGLVTIPGGLEHGYRCLTTRCLVYEEEWPAREGVLSVIGTAGTINYDAWHDESGPCVAHVERPSPTNSGSHEHPYEFVVVVGGGLVRYSINDDAPKDLPTGSLIVIPAKTKHSFYCSAGAPCLRFYEDCGS